MWDENRYLGQGAMQIRKVDRGFIRTRMQLGKLIEIIILLIANMYFI